MPRKIKIIQSKIIINDKFNSSLRGSFLLLTVFLTMIMLNELLYNIDINHINY